MKCKNCGCIEFSKCSCLACGTKAPIQYVRYKDDLELEDDSEEKEEDEYTAMIEIVGIILVLCFYCVYKYMNP